MVVTGFLVNPSGSVTYRSFIKPTSTLGRSPNQTLAVVKFSPALYSLRDSKKRNPYVSNFWLSWALISSEGAPITTVIRRKSFF